MFSNLMLCLCSLGIAAGFRDVPGIVALFVSLAAWQAFCAFSNAGANPASPVVLRLGGLSWRMEDFCRGWLITGQTGSGKTVAAINAMLWQVSRNCPNWGGVCVDDKGVYWETLREMFRHLGREQDLVLLQVRPPDADGDWKPSHTFNVLDDPHLPYSAKAKMICDVAAAVGQRTEQSFFKMQAQVQMEFAFRVLETVGLAVTLSNAYEFLTSDDWIRRLMAMVKERGTPEAEALLEHYQSAFASQPPEQLGGVKTTVANYLKHFTDPDIAAVFCPVDSDGTRFDLADLDRGKVVCVAIPQRFQVERRYINTLLKLMFYAHALRRFDQPAAVRAKNNLLICWADEAQKIVTASEDGMSDYNVVDVIREARATVVAATQSYTSLIPPMHDERKAKVFIANMANRVTFTAADEDSAKIAADTVGKRKSRRKTTGYSGGKRSVSWTEEEKYVIEPHEFRRLRKFEAVVQHCERGFRRTRLSPTGCDGKPCIWHRA